MIDAYCSGVGELSFLAFIQMEEALYAYNEIKIGMAVFIAIVCSALGLN